MEKYSKRITAFVLSLVLVLSLILSGIGLFAVDAIAKESDDGLIDYIVVDSSQQTLDSTQVVTVGINNKDVELEQTSIVYVNETTGEEYKAFATDETNEAVKFEFGFGGCDEGVYRLTGFNYVLNGSAYNIDIQSAGFDIVWGVGVEIITDSDAKVIDETDVDNQVSSDVVYTVTTDNTTYETKQLSSVMTKAATYSSTGRKGNAPNGDVVIVLDPGHGGSDPGAEHGVLQEKNLTLRIATIVRDILSEYGGVQVYMTRTGDYAVGLEDRAQLAWNVHANMFVSIHLNSGGGTGAEVYYPNGNYNGDVSYWGGITAQKIQNNLVALGLANRGAKIRNSENGTLYPDGSLADYYSVIRNTKLLGTPGIIVEHAFMDGDYGRLLDDNFIYQLAVADANAIVDVYGLKKAYTGMYYDGSRWYYMENGSINYSYTGMANNAWGWWYFTNGDIDWTYTGMANNAFGWWYYTNGNINWNYTGFGENALGKWYYENGRLDWNANGMRYVNSVWYMVNGGHVDENYTGMANNYWGWWYFVNGTLDMNYTGMASNVFGWWYYTNGSLDWTYTGEGYNIFGAWFYENGRVNWGANGMIWTGSKWRMANGGHIDTSYTGMGSNWLGYWYFINGELDLNYTGVGQNILGKWLYVNGRIPFDYYGQYIIDGVAYNVQGGHIQS